MKNKKIIYTIFISILIILGICISLICFNKENVLKKDENNSEIQIEEIYANLTDAYIYGTHLNIEGKIKLNSEDIENMTLILVNEEEQLEYNMKYEIQESEIEFTTCEYINRGINLEKISKEEYAFLVKVKEKSGENKYYSLNVNDVKIEELEYYSISKNNMTNHITFKEIQKEENLYFILLLENITMPENIYDITIDAGHGGESPGAVYKGYKESDIVLDYALELKEMLEKQGLKVALTRSKDVLTEEYGENGRAVLPNKVKSKYTFSIHLNSNGEEIRTGVEVYAPSKSDLSFANF